ncbi:MAG: hypothetical protein LUI13_11060 [Lachnospiraceae bacterium]|nr:hypothetical protein [Lachnospiraceae bacterium]
MTREKNTPLGIAMLGLPKLFGKRCIATIYGVVGISSASKNSFYYVNDAHMGFRNMELVAA